MHLKKVIPQKHAEFGFGQKSPSLACFSKKTFLVHFVTKKTLYF
jgi:hypothetical protein